MNGRDQQTGLRRRDWMAAAAAGAVLGLVGGRLHAQGAAAAVPRVGVLYPAPADDPGTPHDQFRLGLREQGLIEGRNLLLEWRWDGRSPDMLAAQVRDLLSLPVQVLVAGHTGAARVAQRLTQSVPIVMAVSADPVADGLVASMARPGGNVTGLSIMSPELTGRRMQLLKDTVPGLARLGLLLDTSARWREELAESEAAARMLGLTLTALRVDSADQLDTAFAQARQARLQALLVAQSPMLSFHWQRLAELCLAARLPAMSGTGDGHFARAGGLMNFGASITGSWHRAAHYVRRVLQGAAPATLPIEQPRRFELAINRRTAAQLGLVLPPHILVLADEVI